MEYIQRGMFLWSEVFIMSLVINIKQLISSIN